MPPVKKASTTTDENENESLESVIKSVRLQMQSEMKKEPDDTEAQKEAEAPVPAVPADSVGDTLVDTPEVSDTPSAIPVAVVADTDTNTDTAVADTTASPPTDAAANEVAAPTDAATDDEVKPSDDAPKDAPEVTASVAALVPVPAPAPIPVVDKPSLPPGVPMGVPMALPATATDTTNTVPPTNNAHVHSNTPAHAHAHSHSNTQSQEAPTLTDKEDIPVQFVGRIIGKGGEQIRDLQARSACKVDVDQNVPHGAPRVITYHGSRDKIDFAKSLVHLLCQENWKNVELPLGFASRASLQVPGTVIGKIIGRGGEMIKVSTVHV